MLCNTMKLSLGQAPTTTLAARPAHAARAGRPTTVAVSARRSSAGADQPGMDPETAALLAAAGPRRRIGARNNAATPAAASKSAAAASGTVQVGPDADFVTKLKAAWRIFFPERQRPLSPKDEGKKRLRMILVADRCGMSNDSLLGMRESIVQAMERFVEVESEEAVEVNLSMDPEIGTIYSVAVPVRRVKPTVRLGLDEDSAVGLWDPNDPNSDPADQFPYGT